MSKTTLEKTKVENAKKCLLVLVQDVINEMDIYLNDPQDVASVGRLAYIVANMASNTISRLQ